VPLAVGKRAYHEPQPVPLTAWQTSAFGDKADIRLQNGPATSSGSVLGILTPIIMDAIAKHQSAAGSLDANGIANLFATQKDNIAAALPSGFGSLLSGADIDHLITR
jgi:hypothetical protein